MAEKKASDLFITAGRAPTIKVDNALIEISKAPLTADQALDIVLSLMNQRQKDEFENTRECQFAIGVP
ncbi:MAG: type IV pili twitching motility protein PilT, partial [Methylococcaceae bacterium]|nr:type IV pili twitching motility protein PilT [Methylococcaceae bacterium]